MTNNWVKVFTTENEFTAEVLKQGLTENDIPAVVVNKKISPYNIGLVEVLVQPENEVAALAYIEETEHE